MLFSQTDRLVCQEERISLMKVGQLCLLLENGDEYQVELIDRVSLDLQALSIT